MFKKAIAILLSLLVLACSTQNRILADNRIKQNVNVHGESISGFFITNDGNHLVVIGTIHHFIFPLDTNLKEILLWGGRSKLIPKFYDVEETASNKVSVTYEISAPEKNFGAYEKAFLHSHHFVDKTMDGYAYTSAIKANLTGSFYMANNVKVADIMKFNHPYFLSYKKSLNSAGKPSPVTHSNGDSLAAGFYLFALPLMVIFGSDNTP